MIVEVHVHVLLSEERVTVRFMGNEMKLDCGKGSCFCSY